MIEPIATEKEIAVLDAALDLIAERGFHNTPMSLITKRSGVSTGIIYHYFENKDNLIQELYRHILDRYLAAVVEADPQDKPFPDSLKQVWLNAYHFHVANPKETLFMEQYQNSPFAKHGKEKDSGESSMRFGEVFKAGYASGLIKELPLEVIFELTLGVAVGLAKRQISGTIDLDDATLDIIADSCSRAVQL